MAILDTTDWGSDDNDPNAPAAAKKPTRTGFVDGVKATWAQESIWQGSKVRSVTEYPYDASFDYKSYDQDLWPLVAGARNKEHADNIVEQATIERRNKEIMDNQNWALGLATGVTVGLTNPLNYIGLGKAATLTTAAVKGAAGAVLGTAATEPLLHSRQVTRTLEDSALNVAGSALLGAPLGAAGKLVSNRFTEGTWLGGKPNVSKSKLFESIESGYGADSISAARARTRTAEDAAIADAPWMPKGWTEKLYRFSIVGPIRRSANQRTQTSDFLATRNAAQALVSNKLATGENAAGVASEVPLEFGIRQNERAAFTKLVDLDKNMRDAWWAKVDSGHYDASKILETLRAFDPALSPDYKVTRTTFDKLLKYHMADADLVKDMPEIETRAKIEVDQRAQIDADKIDFGVYKDKSQLIDISTGLKVVKPEDSVEAIELRKLKTERDELAEELKRASASAVPQGELDLMKAKMDALAEEAINPANRGDKELLKRIREEHSKLRKEYDKARLPRVAKEEIEAIRKRAAEVSASIDEYSDRLAQRVIEYDSLVPTSKTHRFAYEDGSYYLSRAFDKGRILGNRDAFQQSLIEGWAARNPEIDAMDPETYLELKLMAEQVTNKLLNEEYTVSLGELAQNLDLPGKYTKGRTLNLDDRFLVNWTHDDIVATQMRHLSQSITDIEMAKRGLKFADLINNIQDEFKVKVDEINVTMGAGTKKAAKAINALARQRDDDIKELEYIMRRLKRKTPPSQGAVADFIDTSVNRLNVVAGTVQLGSSAFPNSLGDVASTARVMGTGNMLRVIGRMFSPADLADMKSEAKALGILTQDVDNIVREQQFSEMLSESLDPNKGFKGTASQYLDRGLDKLQKGFATVSLVEPWTKVTRVVATETAKRHIVKSAFKGWGKLSKTTQMDFAKFYIDEDMMQRIAKEARAHGMDENNFKVADIARWEDQEAARVIKASIYAHVEQALNVPSVGTGSQFMNEHTIGRILMRYQSFNMASHESMLLSSLQNGDASRLAVGVMNYTALNFMSLLAYDTITGRDTSWEGYFGTQDARELTAWKILLRGGFVAAGADGAVGLLKLLGHDKSPLAEQLREWFPKSIEDEVFPKYKEVDTLAKLAGPTYGYLEKAISTGAGLLDGEWTPKDVTGIRSILPGQNIGWLRSSIDYVEELLGGRDADRNGGSNYTKDAVEALTQ
jgi:hypothetical protein